MCALLFIYPKIISDVAVFLQVEKVKGFILYINVILNSASFIPFCI